VVWSGTVGWITKMASDEKKSMPLVPKNSLLEDVAKRWNG